jgi:hypothetical protein
VSIQLELFNVPRQVLSERAAARIPASVASETDPLVYARLNDGERASFYVVSRDSITGELCGLMIHGFGCTCVIDHFVECTVEHDCRFTDATVFPQPRNLSAALRADRRSFALDTFWRLP